MPRKVRELIHELTTAGFEEVPGGGKGLHRKFTHSRYRGTVKLSGRAGDDAKPYQEQQVQQALEEIQQ